MQLTRLELYELVCGSPLSKVGPELGVSGTALAAICKQHHVPYPESAYWTRKSLGASGRTVNLPGASDETLEIIPRTPKPRRHKSGDKSSTTTAKAVVKTHRPVRHPLLSGVEEYFLAQPVNLWLLRLNLPLTGKGMLRIGPKLSDLFAQHALMKVQIAGGLGNRNILIFDQPYRFKPELAAELPSCHYHTPAPSNTLSRCSQNRQQLSFGFSV